MTIFTNSQWATLLNQTFDQIQSLAKLKGEEYSGDQDRLANFRRNAQALGLPMEVIWAVYAGKHWDAVQQWVRDLATQTHRERAEPIEGRVDDLLVYLLLFKAMLVERNGEKTVPEKAAEAPNWAQYKAKQEVKPQSDYAKAFDFVSTEIDRLRGK